MEKVFNKLTTVLFILVLLSALGCLIPVITGQAKFLVVLSGSMSPTINPGDLLVVDKTDPVKIQKGDIISYTEKGEFVTHRVVDVIEKNGKISFKTKGDANEESDIIRTSSSDVMGKVILTLPYTGHLVKFVRSPLGFILFIIIPAILLIVGEVRKILKHTGGEGIKIKTLTLLILFSFGLLLSGRTHSYLFDIETSTGNFFQASSWWTQTSQQDFEAGVLERVDTTTNPGSVTLTGAYSLGDETIGLWHLNEGYGSIIEDSSGNDNDGTINGAIWVDGKWNKSLSFDGVDDYVSIPDDPSLDITDGITVEFWIYLRSYSTAGGNGVTKESSYKCGVNSGKKAMLRFITESGSWGSTVLYGNTDVSLNTWHHIAGTYNSTSGQAKIYLDGLEDGTATFSGKIVANDRPLWIGRGNKPYFDGLIDEVRISNVAKTEFPVKYFNSGNIESQVFDAGSEVSWNSMNWIGDVPGTGTDLSLQVATSNDGSSWSSWSS
ncbi:MAG: signal peptidase I, partial [Candidatus Aenigmarchaeota archaeon]|nr:signal peptidase I [Candidatus Aenigmarchaeota archaeon]